MTRINKVIMFLALLLVNSIFVFILLLFYLLPC